MVSGDADEDVTALHSKEKVSTISTQHCVRTPNRLVFVFVVFVGKVVASYDRSLPPD